ncbi:MAG: hypothetical protein NW237_11870 [Cyanobacteriota bacterium]|nr:hypothetical protein [Cyanobacteriota bacterium]
MEPIVMIVASLVALLVGGLEGWRNRQDWQSLSPLAWRGIGVGLTVCAGLAVALRQFLQPDSLTWALLLLGGLLGVGLSLLSGLGRAAQALVLLGVSLGTGLLPADPEVVLPHLAALGLGSGLVGIPTLLVMPASAGQGLLLGMGQLWVWIAAVVWGSRLASLSNPQDGGWMVLLPLGLVCLSILGGTIPLLVGNLSPATQTWQTWIGRAVGWLVTELLAIALIHNWLRQDSFYGLIFGAGLLGSLALLALEHRPVSSTPPLPGSWLWRGTVSLLFVGGGSLLALRLGGSYGAALLGIGLLAWPGYWATLAALFLAARPLVQSLLYQFDLNLSGINITHSYTYAALYLGIAVMLLAAVTRYTYSRSAPLLTAVGLTLASVALPGLVGFFIHLEPQAAFLLAAMMVGLVIAALEPIWAELPGIPNWLGAQGLLWTILACLTALLTTPLTTLGDTATRVERLIGLAIVTGILAVGTLVLHRWQAITRSQHPTG